MVRIHEMDAAKGSTYHVCHSHENEDESLNLVSEETFQMLETVEEASDHMFCGFGGRFPSSWLDASHVRCGHVNSCELLHGQRWGRCSIEFGDFVQNFDSFRISTSAQEEFG